MMFQGENVINNVINVINKLALLSEATKFLVAKTVIVNIYEMTQIHQFSSARIS